MVFKKNGGVPCNLKKKEKKCLQLKEFYEKKMRI